MRAKSVSLQALLALGLSFCLWAPSPSWAASGFDLDAYPWGGFPTPAPGASGGTQMELRFFTGVSRTYPCTSGSQNVLASYHNSQWDCTGGLAGFEGIAPSATDGQLLQYRTSDNKWHSFSLGGQATISNAGNVTNNNFTLSGNASANSNKITSLAVGASSGDALGFGLNHLNDLATATANYSMGSNKLTSIADAAADGDALSRGNVPAPTWTCFKSILTGAAVDFCKMTIPKAIQVVRMQVQLVTSPVTCATDAVIRITSGGVNIDVTLTSGGGQSFDSGVISTSYSAGSTLIMSLQTGAAGCGTSPATAMVTAQYMHP